MRSVKIIASFFFVFGLFFSCHKDKLNIAATGLLDEDKIANKRGVEALLIGAYALLDGVSQDEFGWVGGWYSGASNWIYGSVIGSEAYTGAVAPDRDDIRSLELFMTATNSHVVHEKWVAVFSGVQRANDVLRIMKKAEDIKEEDAKRISAEARFLRAHYHFEAAKMWNKVPFVDESVTYSSGNYFLSNEAPIWPAIEADLEYAMKNLKEVQIAVGRANKYAAEAYLAKAYLFQKKWADAKPLLQDLIQKGVTAGGLKYDLVNYADNFNPATKNSKESVFSVQMSVNDGAPGANGNWGDVLNFPYIYPYVNGGSCCGFFKPTQYFVNHFKTDGNGLPELDNFNVVSIKSDDGLLSSEPFTPYEGFLDPRLDWTVGRRGIPYLDWGVHSGEDWINGQQFSGPYSPKKNVYYQSQAEH
jgi:hypothetical protein